MVILCAALRSRIKLLKLILLFLELILAGEVGIEPTNAGIKIRCLTAWRLPKFITLPKNFVMDDKLILLQQNPSYHQAAAEMHF